MIRTEEEHLAHYGILRRSGRYPWGSGGTQSQRNRDFLDYVSNLRKQGMTDAEIARGQGISRNDLTAARSIALAQQKQEKIATATRLKEKGWSNVAIGQRMGLNESSVRALLAPGEKDKASAIETTASVLRDQVKEKKMIDVGKGVEKQLGITKDRLNTSIAVLREEGHEVYNIQILQVNTGKYTTMKVLAAPGVSKAEVQRNRKNIRQIVENYSEDNGRSFLHTQPPLSISSRRVGINYAESGGGKLDGVIHIRPGVKDLSIGSKRYGQVRIMIDGTHYIKGMAIYKEDLPTGKDLVFNTKLHNTGRKKDAMKELEPDPDLPFGSIIRQVHGPDGKVTSAVNLVGSPTREGSGEEGHWDTWRKEISSQMLSKQSPDLARQQLNLTFDRRKRELDEIMALTNPTVRKELLLRFADQTDSASVHLSAANMRRQANKVLLPVPSMKPTEIYAPTFRDGERVVLIRHPHGGTFEIPELTVNNRNREAKRLLGPNPLDAVGIHHKVAERLSGADFDGDTVLVIPNPKGSKNGIISTPALEGLKGFDPMQYKLPKDSPIPRITDARKQQEMGKISNLITDMTLHGANTEHLARAIRHSMVVIDSKKHELDFIQSEKDNGILALKEEYQGGKRRGAATLISRAGAVTYVPQRQERPMRRGGPIEKSTGKKVFEPTGRMVPKRVVRTVTDPVTGEKKRVKVETGELVPKLQRSKRMAETEDASTLIGDRGTRMEIIYADHANRLKAMANAARKEAVSTKSSKMSPSAKKVYAEEVKTINHKLNVAERNAPYERQAQLLANAEVSQKRQANPHIEPEDITKIKQQALNKARNRTGAKKTKITLTQKEWDAIQAGAISNDKLERIINNSDLDTVKTLAMPKHKPAMTSTKRLRAQSMLASGYTQAEVADALGVGLTTLKLGLSE